jgi:WD40 repeat protein
MQMGNLQLYEKWEPNGTDSHQDAQRGVMAGPLITATEIKITPQRIYSMSFHPMENKPLIFAGDKEGAMGIFDASQDGPDYDDEEAERFDPDIKVLKTHTRTITSFVFPPADVRSVYTGSYDSSIRKFDIEQGKSTQVFAPADPDEDLPVSALDMPSNDANLLVFSTLLGHLGRHDVREPASAAEVWHVCDHKIGGFSLHPLQPHLVATASLDRTVKIWDLRKIKKQAPALLGEHESRLSVSHASWSAGGSLATSSYDDTIKIYAFPDAGSWAPGHTLSEADMTPAYKISHNNQTGRWVTILKPQWQRRPADGIEKFAIGNMNRFVDLFAANGQQLAQLGGDGISAVPAVAHFHPSKNWVVGGTASGKVCLWM